MDISGLYTEDLEWLLNKANEWRGFYIGHPDPNVLAEFDKKISDCRKILSLIIGREIILKDEDETST